MRGKMQNKFHFSLGSFLDDERSNIITGFLIVLGVGPVAVGELATLPATTENSLKILNQEFAILMVSLTKQCLQLLENTI
jgi:hypothetical protein